MENQLLKYLALVKTVETGSFTRAAQALNYAQSSVSKMVADLKAKWGMTLLERSKRGVCLTSAGEQVLPFLRKVLNDHADLEGQICRINGIETGGSHEKAANSGILGKTRREVLHERERTSVRDRAGTVLTTQYHAKLRIGAKITHRRANSEILGETRRGVLHARERTLCA